MENDLKPQKLAPNSADGAHWREAVGTDVLHKVFQGLTEFQLIDFYLRLSNIFLW